MQTIVGVLRGGPSREHEVSLRSGAAMLANLPEERYTARDIYIDRKGQWHDRGRPTAPERVLRQIDVALIGLHGEYGEDGEVQKLLEKFGVPYSGADSFGSYLAMHKIMAKTRTKEAGLLTPEFRYIEDRADTGDTVHEIIRSFHQPVVVKPVGWGSSVGVSIVGGYAPVLSAVEKLFSEGAPSVVVEEYIRGREATAGVVEKFRDEALYALPIVEGGVKRTCPGNFSRVIREELQVAAKAIHRALGLRHYSQSNFVVAPKGLYYLGTNSLPALSPEHTFAMALSAVGVPLKDFLSHLITGSLS